MAGGKSRHRLIISFMAALGLLLAGRLFMLTVIQNDKWESYAEDMSMRAVYETGPRGDIVDRNGRIIATSSPVYSVNISRVDIDKEKALTSAAEVMSFLEFRGEDVNVTQQDVKDTLADNGYMSYMPITLAEDVSAETANAIQQEGYPGVYISKNYVREYPEGAVASHVVGYLGRISEDESEVFSEEKGYRQDAMIGKSGIEKYCEDVLKADDGVSRLQVDSLGNVTDILDKSDTEKGDTVRLTIDLDLQKTAEDALEQAVVKAAAGGTFISDYGNVQMTYAKNAAVGAAVVIDVKTGQVLAMASCPDFDPNDFVTGISSEKWAALQQENPNDPLSPSPMYNVAALSAVQPGSTFKPVTALAALSCGLDEKRALYDAGYVSIAGRKFGCFLWNDTKATHGYVDLAEAMKVSCNYYFYDIAIGMDLASDVSLGYEEEITNETIGDFAKKLGLGEKTGIEIDETSGSLPSRALKKQAVKSSLREFLTEECETYFKKSVLKDRDSLEDKMEKIINWSDKDLTLQEIIGKLKKEDSIKNDKVTELAEICKYTYFDQMEWSVGDTFNISIGQGDNAYTTVQMARYMAAIGNGGIKSDLSLIMDEERENSENLEDAADTGGSVSSISPSDLEVVTDAMTEVTSARGGSLYGVFGNFPYAVAAKTGTAQRAGKINTSDEKDYLKRHLHLIAPDVSFGQAEEEAARLMEEYPDIYGSEVKALRRAVINLSSHDITAEDIDQYKESYDNFAWTVALAPADDPQIAVAVMLVQGKTSLNAAPVVREIIGKYGEISEWEKLF